MNTIGGPNNAFERTVKDRGALCLCEVGIVARPLNSVVRRHTNHVLHTKRPSHV